MERKIKMKMPDKYFFGWTNFKKVVIELNKMYSDQPSFYSKKRIESGIAFLVLQWGLIHWLFLNVMQISASDLFIWASIEAVFCGYAMHKMESEKTL